MLDAPVRPTTAPAHAVHAGANVAMNAPVIDEAFSLPNSDSSRSLNAARVMLIPIRPEIAITSSISIFGSVWKYLSDIPGASATASERSPSRMYLSRRPELLKML